MRRAGAVGIVVGTLTTVLGAGTALAASGGYGPSVPTGPTNAPGGFTSVVATRTVGSSGGTVTAHVTGANATITVPVGTFTSPVQVEVTAPDVASANGALGSLGLNGSVLGGIGVKLLTSTGTPITGTFSHPITVILRDSAFGTGDRVVELTGPTGAVSIPATATTGTVIVSITSDPDLLVLSPAVASTTVPGATSQNTGEPVGGILATGAALMGAGIVLVATGRARRRSSAR